MASNSSSASSHSSELVLSYTTDRYNGVKVSASALCGLDVISFAERLSASLEHWKKEKRRGIWLEVDRSPEQALLIAPALRLGFSYHHVSPAVVTEGARQRPSPPSAPGVLVLCCWIGTGSSRLPDAATHTVGIGGFVLSDEGDVLVVAERYASRKLAWKLPGGYVQCGEPLHEAVVREVKEETNVDAEFQRVLCFRHLHPFQFGFGDLYYVALLRPLSRTIELEADEISACRWMPLEEYMKDERVYVMNREIAQLVHRLRAAGQLTAHGGLVPQQVSFPYSMDFNELYMPPALFDPPLLRPSHHLPHHPPPTETD
eukprot:CAMPEP_0174232792 /NCGR_PEP_ID=MMETSP0417-20130205/2980_1 /TAXON_ID=242541 /ORGANISM="Mayorella sp, Strain BSH-02190019" /LENGTH=315 /DNA_ID=CAMNT_0015310897 /DNA_START=578 /DNA_END=1523 /DNA_ORIENTATION=-